MKIKTLLLYSTTDGQTVSICKSIKSTLSKQMLVDIVSLDDVKNLNLTDYNQVIIGASIRYGKHKPELFDFIASYKDEDVIGYTIGAGFTGDMPFINNAYYKLAYTYTDYDGYESNNSNNKIVADTEVDSIKASIGYSF